MIQQQPFSDRCVGLLGSMRGMQLHTSVLLQSVNYRQAVQNLCRQWYCLDRQTPSRHSSASTSKRWYQIPEISIRQCLQALRNGLQALRETGTISGSGQVITENLCQCFLKEQHYWQNLQKQQYMGNRKQEPDGSKPFMCSRKFCTQQVPKVSKFTEHTTQEKPLGLYCHRRTTETCMEYYT